MPLCLRSQIFFLFIAFSYSNQKVSAQDKFRLTQIKSFPYTKSACLQASPDGSYLVIEKQNAFQIYNRTATGFEPGEVITGFNTDFNFTNHFCISHDGNLLSVLSIDNTICVFKRDKGSFTKLMTITDFEGAAHQMSFSADNKYFSASEGKCIIWKISGDEFTKIAEIEAGSEFMFSPADKDIAYADGKIYKFNDEKLALFQDLDKDASWTDKMNFSPDGNYFCKIADPHGRAKIILWKKQKNGTYIQTSITDYDNKDSDFLEFSPDGKYISAYDDHSPPGRKRIFIYEIDSDTLALKIALSGYQDNMERFQFISDGKFAVSGGYHELIIFQVEGVKGNHLFKSQPFVANVAPVKKEPEPIVKEDIKTNPPAAAPTINIFWISPNPDVMDDKPVVVEKNTLDVQVKIISNKKVGKEDIQIFINGKEIKQTKFNEVSLRESAHDQQFEYTYANVIPLEETPDHINMIEVVADGKKCSKAVKVLYSATKPNLHILAIGTSLDLQFPQKDAADFATLFESQGGVGDDKLFGTVDVRKLIGKEATTNAIKEAIERYRYEFNTGAIGPRDVMLVFISSHGFIYQDKFRIQGDDFKDIYKETYSVAYDEITSRLKEVACKKLIFLDACFSGGAKASVSDINNAIRDLNNQSQGVTTFSSSSNEEYSYEDEKWQNGAFTYSIKDALVSGKADKNNNGIITIGELYEYVSMLVPQLVTQVKGKSQHPTMPVTDLLKDTPVFVIHK